MKTMSKKLASIVLALCLCVSLVGTALAADTYTFTTTSNSATVLGDALESGSVNVSPDATITGDGTTQQVKLGVGLYLEAVTSQNGGITGYSLYRSDAEGYHNIATVDGSAYNFYYICSNGEIDGGVRYFTISSTSRWYSTIVDNSSAFVESSRTTSNTGSITVNGASGETYSIYRIFELTYTADGSTTNDSRSSYSYKVTGEWTSFITEYEFDDDTKFDLDENGYLTNANDIKKLEDSDLAEFAQAALAYAGNERSSITATRTATAGADGVATIDNLELGWYLVDSSLGSLCMLTNTDPDVEINEKNGTPTVDNMYVIDKTKSEGEEDFDHDKDTASVIDALEYEIVLSNVANSSGLILHVSLDSDLTPGSNSIVVKLSNGNVVDSTNYTKEDTDDGFKISFNDDFLATLNSEDQLLVTFDATISASAGDFTGDLADFSSKAWLTYGNAQASVEVSAEVYSYGFEVYKYTESENVLAEKVYLDAGNYYIIFHNKYSPDLSFYLANGSSNAGKEDDLAANLFTMGNGNGTSSTANAFLVEIEESGEYFFHYKDTYNTEDRYADAEPFYMIEKGDAPNLGTTQPDESKLIPMERAYYEIINGYAVEATDGTEKSALAGAVFTLQNEEGQYGEFSFDIATNTYVLNGWEEGIIDNCYMTSTATGNILIEGLDLGTYTLTETAAPDGYNKLENPLIITIAADDGDYSSFTVTVKTGSDGEEQTAAGHIVNVLNNQGSELPGTGGIGTTIFYIIGGILVVGAVVVLVIRRRMNREA